MKYTSQIRKIAKGFFDELDRNDFSHGFPHIGRITRLALHIGKIEKADLEVLEAAGLLHDIARGMEDRGEIEDHAEESARLAKDILIEVGFPKEKIDKVCHCINVHRSEQAKLARTLEAKILQDADRLDALGAVDIARVIGSKLQSEKYGGPIYVDKPYMGEEDINKSAIHYLIYKSKHPKRKPENFNTKTGREMAHKRFQYTVDYVNRFVKEWHGEI